MNMPLSRLRAVPAAIRSTALRGWRWYRGRKRWQQALIALAAVGIVGGIIHVSSRNSTADASQLRTVTVESVAALEGGADSGTSIVGKVRSVTEADLLAQVGGTVESVHTTLGAQVPAGFVIMDLDNASEAAAVLQAQGAYDAAIAARNITSLQSGSAQTSFMEAQNEARTAYQTAYTTIDTTLTTEVDQLFGGPTPVGPQLLISPGTTGDTLPRRRQAITYRMNDWQTALASANTGDPTALLNQAYTDTQVISTFLVDLAAAARDRQSGASTAQMTALSTARATVDGELSAISAARDAYNAKKTAAATAGNISSSQGTQLAAADANVEAALGALRAAQAAYEKTRIRATIGGTVNYLPSQVGQYVSAFQHVATIANNGALEIVAYVPQEQRNDVAVGMKVSVEGGHDGIVTSVATALDPTTQQIEVHVAVNATPDLVNGQSVRITLPPEASATKQATASSTPAAPSQDLLPLTAVKLLPDSRAVFTVDANGRVVAHTVTVGDVVGDRILVTSGLTPDLVIITDVRGLSEGQKVQIGSGS